MLQTKNISKSFRGPDGTEMQVLKNVTLSLRDGEILGVLGANGSGRSTLLRIISGEIPPDTGFVCVDGERIDRIPPFKRLQLIKRVTSDSHAEIPTDATVEGVLTEPPSADSLHRPAQTSFEAIVQSFEIYVPNFAEFIRTSRNTPIEHLSVGQCQLVAMARAILARPNLLVLDGHLDQLDRQQRNDANSLTAFAALTGELVIVAKSDDLEWITSVCTTGTNLIDGENHNFVITREF